MSVCIYDNDTALGLTNALTATRELGNNFTSLRSITVRQLRVYGTATSGSITMTLWNAAGTSVGSATGTITAAGWTYCTLATPVVTVAGANYTVSVNNGAGLGFDYTSTVPADSYGVHYIGSVYNTSAGSFPSTVDGTGSYSMDIVADAIWCHVDMLVSPAGFSAFSGIQTTASFTPAAGDLLVYLWAGESGPPTPSSTAGGTWTSIGGMISNGSRQAETFVMDASAVSQTCSMSSTFGGTKLCVVKNARSAAKQTGTTFHGPTGAANTGTSWAPTMGGSLGLISYNDGSGPRTPLTNSNRLGRDPAGLGYGAAQLTAPTMVTGSTTVTFGFPSGATCCESFVEILPLLPTPAIDSSTPAHWGFSSNPTNSASFTPPAGSLLVVLGAYGSPPTTLTVTGSAATFKQVVLGTASTSFNSTIWVADASAVSQTATLTTTGGFNASGQLLVITGAAASKYQTGNATAIGSNNAAVLTPTRANSLLVVANGNNTSPAALSNTTKYSADTTAVGAQFGFETVLAPGTSAQTIGYASGTGGSASAAEIFPYFVPPLPPFSHVISNQAVPVRANFF